MGRMSDLDIALHEGIEEETECGTPQGDRHSIPEARRAESGGCPRREARRSPDEYLRDRRKPRAKDAFRKANPGKPASAMEEPEPEATKHMLEEVRKAPKLNPEPHPEGIEFDGEWKEIKEQHQGWRDEINRLEEELK